MTTVEATFIDELHIQNVLKSTRSPDQVRLGEILAKAREMKGLNHGEIAELMMVEGPVGVEALFQAAKSVKDEIYGRRIVLFAPLYVSNYCRNECSYCAFRAGNKQLRRRALTQEEVAEEIRHLIRQGHKRVLMVSGESYPQNRFEYVLECIDTIYATKEGKGEIRRVNVNLAPMPVDKFKQLKEHDIGTFQLFQETYHRETYKKVHTAGDKANYDWRTTAFDRAMEAGIDDVGMGVLFGLYDWKFEVLAMMQQIAHLEQTFGCGPHTISVPRIEPACGSTLADRPPHVVSDADFMKLVAIVRLAVPYTGIIMSTRENAQTRRETLALGVSQISAGSRTNPGGYAELGEEDTESQFSLGDHRPVDEVIRDVASLGYIPSFCTACYRLGRTGADFMDMAKPGLIKRHCSPNAMSSFLEYLEDYASPETKAVGEKLIQQELGRMTPIETKIADRLMTKIRIGQRDVYV
jgi:2-iminoacetate synthase